LGLLTVSLSLLLHAGKNILLKILKVIVIF
jgi:hypothetical protein